MSKFASGTRTRGMSSRPPTRRLLRYCSPTAADWRSEAWAASRGFSTWTTRGRIPLVADAVGYPPGDMGGPPGDMDGPGGNPAGGMAAVCGAGANPTGDIAAVGMPGPAIGTAG